MAQRITLPGNSYFWRTAHDQTGQDTTSNGEPNNSSNGQTTPLEAQVKKLKAENFQLQIDRAAKEQVIERLMDERENITRQAIDLSREVGRLENQLLQLEAPARPEMSRHDETPKRDTNAAEGHVVEIEKSAALSEVSEAFQT